jgi:ribose transport system permease protein
VKASPPAASRVASGTGLSLLSTAGPFLGLALVLGLFALSNEVRPFLFTGANFKIVFSQTVIVAVGALGMTMIIVSGGIDLSVGSVVAFTNVLAAKLLVSGWSTPSVVAGCVIAGGVIGLLNGSVIAYFRLLPFIVTLGAMGIVRGSAKWLSDKQTINNPENVALNRLMALEKPQEFLPLPPGIWIALCLAVVIAVLMRRTVFGRHIVALGSNEAAALLSGVRVSQAALSWTSLRRW